MTYPLKRRQEPDTVIFSSTSYVRLAGSQYCAWSDDSRLLAASCDTFHAVVVWGVPSFQQLLRVQYTLLPALALTWMPLQAGVLAFAEAKDAFYVMSELS